MIFFESPRIFPRPWDIYPKGWELSVEPPHFFTHKEKMASGFSWCHYHYRGCFQTSCLFFDQYLFTVLDI